MPRCGRTTLPLVDDRRVGGGHLERRRLEVALADREVDVVARRPLALDAAAREQRGGRPRRHLGLLGAAQVLLVALVAPLRVRHQAGELAGDVDPGPAPDAEPLRPLLEHRAAPVHVRAERVEEDVRGHGHGARQRERPVDGVLGVLEHAVAELELAVVDDRRLRRDDALLERRHRRDRLEGRAGRIGGGDRAVEQRRAELLAGELVVARLRDRLGELVGVEARVGAEREDLAVARVHGHEGAGLGAVLRRGARRRGRARRWRRAGG